MAAKPRAPSLFSAKDGEDIGESNPFLGDIDGDGFDDFFIMARLPEAAEPPVFTGFTNNARIYLYYGRANFPSRLSTADADAVFESMEYGGGPLGDLNGDGLADFVIMRAGSLEIVFGSRQRLHGAVGEGNAGVRWQPAEAPIIFGTGVPTELYIGGLGDLNGDGYADLGVAASRSREPAEARPGISINDLATSYYLVLGRAGSWPSGIWDPSWASARFGDEEYVESAEDLSGKSSGTSYFSPLTPMPAGDLDADGYDDLIVAGAKSPYLFYGGRTWTGVITVDQADVSFADEQQFAWPMALGDADGDGAADLLITSSDSTGTQVMYGRRWSGRVKLQPDLSIFVAGVASREANAAAGDIDGDGSPEIVIAAAMAGQDESSQVSGPPRGALYVMRGSGTRALGEVHLTDANLLLKGPKAGARDPKATGDGGIGWTLSMTGDVDGDGGLDILTSSPNAITSSQSLGGVFLVPSTPKMPL